MDWYILGDRIDGAGEVFTIPQAVRKQHIYMLGRTGSGKSTFLARLALADIARGDGLMVLDPHGDLVEDIIAHCPPEHLDRIIYLDPADREHPVPLNMFDCRPGDDKDTVCSEVIGIFKRLFGDAWGFRLEDLLRNLTLAMLDHQLLGNEDVHEEHRYNATLKEAHDFLFNQNLRREYYPYITNMMVRDFWQSQYDHLGTLKPPATVTFAQINYASSVTNKIRRFLLNTLVFDITANKDVVTAIDLREVIDGKKVLLVNLSKGKLGEDNSALIGSVLLSRLVVAALSRVDTPKADRDANLFHVIADEFQAFATESFKLLLSEARKYGITLTIAHQHREQLDLEMKGAVLNCGSLVSFRVAGRDAADIGREYDATPIVSGFKFEREMFLQDADLSTWVNESLKHSPTWGPIVARIEALRLEYAAALGHIKDAKHAAECDKPYHGNCPYIHEKVISLDDLPAALARATSEHLHRVEELSLEIERLQASLPSLAPDCTGGYWTPAIDGVSGARSGGYVTEDPATRRPVWEPVKYDPDPTWDRYKRIPQFNTYADRERQIANELTQLPNYTAYARLSDGVHAKISSRALPESPIDHADRVAERREATRMGYAIRDDLRRSVREAAYFGALRRQQAYEAELDEQPTD